VCVCVRVCVCVKQWGQGPLGEAYQACCKFKSMMTKKGEERAREGVPTQSASSTDTLGPMLVLGGQGMMLHSLA